MTLAWVLVDPGWLSGVGASLYPAVIAAGAVHVSRRGANVLAAFAALATVHLSWSAGFAKGCVVRSA
jgi:hypothetical protein